MENLEMIAIELISNAGVAKSSIFEAMECGRNGKFEEAENKLKEAEQAILKAHESHFSLIQKEANGEKVEFSLILMHAEDQLMNVETLKALAKELILTHKKYS